MVLCQSSASDASFDIRIFAKTWHDMVYSTYMCKRFILIFCITLSLATTSAWAEGKTIALKDGSVIKGKVVSLQDGVYTVETQSFGTMFLSESDIVSISSRPLSQQVQNLNTSNNTAPIGTSMGSAGFASQMQTMQASLMSNPQIMGEIQNLMEDPEIMKAFSDPSFVNAAMKHDVQALENDPNTQKLLDNPKMRALVEKIQASGY